MSLMEILAKQALQSIIEAFQILSSTLVSKTNHKKICYAQKADMHLLTDWFARKNQDDTVMENVVDFAWKL